MKKVAVLNEFSIEAVRDALQKLDDFPKLTVNGLNAFQLNEICKIDPLLFNAVAVRISEGRWMPFVGMWTDEDGKISDENLTRNILYSSRYFKDNFDKKYRVFCGGKINSNSLAQIVYAAGFDACFIKGENEAFWLDSADGSRTLIGGQVETVDINDIDDDFINANEFGSFEDEITEKFSVPLDLKTVRLPFEASVPTEDEKLLVEAEKIAVQNGEKLNEKIENLWIEIFLGGSIKNEAEEIIGLRKNDENFLTINSDEAKLVSMKYAEDESGDVIVRIKETAGKEKTIFVMCDRLDAGFRCEILPYELQTFRIDRDGFVKEIFICE